MLKIKNQIVLFSSLIILFFVASRFIELSDTALHWLTDSAWTIFAGIATWQCYKVAKISQGNQRIAWLFFAAANLSWFLGILIWDYLELIVLKVTPFPALSDIGFSLMAPLFVFGMFFYRRNEINTPSTLLQISKLGILFNCILIAHIIIFNEPIKHQDSGFLYLTVALGYPVLYLSCFVYGVFGFFQIPSGVNLKIFTLILLSILTHAVSDSVYAYSVLGKNYAVGNFIDVFWLIAFSFFYFAGLLAEDSVKSAKEQLHDRNQFVLKKNIEGLVTPISILVVIATFLLFYDSLHRDVVDILLPFIFLMAVFVATREWASTKLEKKLNASIIESEKNFRDLSANIPGIAYQFIVTHDGQRYFPYVSPNVDPILGTTDVEIMNNANKWFERIHPADIEDLEKTIMESYQTLNPWTWEGRMQTKDGSYTWYQGNSVPRKLQDGSVLWNGIVHDISRHREAEAILKRDKDILEEMVRDRTEELISAKEKAEQSNAAKTEFLSHMSHELRTPLNAIVGFSQLLLLDKLHPSQKDSVHEIMTAGNVLISLIDDILDLSGIESGNVKINLSSVNAPSLVSKVINLIQPLADMKNISVNVPEENLNKIIIVDELKFQQVLMNLLSNAIKYNHEGGQITVYAETISDGMLKINVKDTGVGIPADKYKSVFEEFNRLGNEKSNIQGSGIGLALSKKLINLMEGEIGFSSIVNEGSTFWVTCKIDVSKSNQPSYSVEESDKLIRSLLYIEDNPANITLMQRIVDYAENTDLIIAKTAEEGLALAKTSNPALIFLDINLPGMDGYQALQHLKADPQTSNIPVYAVTAAAMASDVAKGKNAGFVDYITKPIQVTEVLSLIKETISSDN